MAERKLSLVILGKATGALAAIKSVGDEAGGLGSKLTSLLPSFKTVAIAGAAAFGAITAAAGFAIKAAAEDAEGQAKLARQLEATTGATKSQIEEVERQIETLSLAASVADDDLRPAFENLVRGTGDVTQAQKLLGLAVDISAGSGRDLSAVSIALSRAANGNFTALTRLGVPLDENAVKTKNLNAVVKQLDGQFAGAASTSADTFAGKMRGLRIGIDEINEKVGELLLPYVEQFVGFLKNNLVPAVDLAITKFKGTGSFSDAVAFLVGGLGGLAPAAINAFRVVGNTAIDTTQILLRTYGVIAALVGGFRAIATRGKDLSGITMAGQGFAALIGSAGLGVAQENFNKSLDNLAVNAKRAAEIINAPLNPAIVGANERLEGFGGKVKRVSEDLTGLGDEVGKTGGKVKEVAGKMKVFTDVLTKARDATRSQTDATKAVGDAQDVLTKKTSGVTAAQARFDTIVKGFSATARESIDAARRFADAQRGVRDAGHQVADATRGVTEAEKRLADLRAQKADIGKVGAAERALERSKYGVEEANFRVTDAERELAALRLDPDASATAIRRAEIDLLEAKLSVADSVLTIADAERRLADERDAAASPDEIADAERNLQRAKMQVVDAIDAQTRAIEDESDAQATLNEITMGAAVGSKVYEDALQDLTDAKRDQQDASESLAKATRNEADALRDLADATTTLLAAQGVTKGGVQGRAAAGLGVLIGAGGSVIENIATVSGNTRTAAAAGAVNFVTNVQTGAFTNPADVGAEVVDALAAYVRANGFIPLGINRFAEFS